MRDISTTIQTIKEDMISNIPGLLQKSGLKDFDYYSIGYPTDQAKLYCAIRFANGNISDKNEFTFTIQIQLPGIVEELAYKYIDVISNYLTVFNQQSFGYIFKTYAIEVLENFKAGDFQAFFDVTMSTPFDDCEEN